MEIELRNWIQSIGALLLIIGVVSTLVATYPSIMTGLSILMSVALLGYGVKVVIDFARTSIDFLKMLREE